MRSPVVAVLPTPWDCAETPANSRHRMSLLCSILVSMTSNRPDSTVEAPTRIADNSRHERREGLAGGEIVPQEALDITALPDRMSVWMERYLTLGFR